jgi:hypothetical protein
MSVQVYLKQLSPQVLEYIQQGENFFRILWNADNVVSPNNTEEIEARLKLSDGDRLKIHRNQINLVQILEDGKRNSLLDLGNGWRELHDFLNYETEEVAYLTAEKFVKGNNLVCVNAVLGATKFKYNDFHRFLTANEVVQVSTLLSKISKNLKERLELLDVDLDEFVDEVEIGFEQFFQNFVDYYVSASSRGNAMLIVISA